MSRPKPRHAERAPEPEQPGLARRVLDMVVRRSHGSQVTGLPRSTDPKRAHTFRETNDTGIGAVSSGGGYQGNLANIWGVTAAVLRGTRCALPGCGKERHDPMHTLADD